MIAIIVDNYAHILMNDGIVRSAPLSWVRKTIVSQEDFDITSEFNWSILDPICDLQMTPGDFDAFIRKNLILLNQIFPADRPKLPSSEKQENVAQVLAPMGA